MEGNSFKEPTAGSGLKVQPKTRAGNKPALVKDEPKSPPSGPPPTPPGGGWIRPVPPHLSITRQKGRQVPYGPGSYGKASQAMSRALVEDSALKQRAAAEAAVEYRRTPIERQEIADRAEARRADIEAKMSRVVAELTALERQGAEKIDPQRHWKTEGVGAKQAAMAAAGVYAMGQAIAGMGGGNPIFDNINKMIANDIAAQKADLQNLSARKASKMNLLGFYQRALGDERAAEAMTYKRLAEDSADRLKGIALRTQVPQLRVAAHMTALKLEQDAMKVSNDIALKMQDKVSFRSPYREGAAALKPVTQGPSGPLAQAGAEEIFGAPRAIGAPGGEFPQGAPTGPEGTHIGGPAPAGAPIEVRLQPGQAPTASRVEEPGAEGVLLEPPTPGGPLTAEGKRRLEGKAQEVWRSTQTPESRGEALWDRARQTQTYQDFLKAQQYAEDPRWEPVSTEQGAPTSIEDYELLAQEYETHRRWLDAIPPEERKSGHVTFTPLPDWRDEPDTLKRQVDRMREISPVDPRLLAKRRAMWKQMIADGALSANAPVEAVPLPNMRRGDVIIGDIQGPGMQAPGAPGVEPPLAVGPIPPPEQLAVAPPDRAPGAVPPGVPVAPGVVTPGAPVAPGGLPPGAIPPTVLPTAGMTPAGAAAAAAAGATDAAARGFVQPGAPAAPDVVPPPPGIPAGGPGDVLVGPGGAVQPPMVPADPGAVPLPNAVVTQPDGTQVPVYIAPQPAVPGVPGAPGGPGVARAPGPPVVAPQPAQPGIPVEPGVVPGAARGRLPWQRAERAREIGPQPPQPGVPGDAVRETARLQARQDEINRRAAQEMQAAQARMDAEEADRQAAARRAARAASRKRPITALEREQIAREKREGRKPPEHRWAEGEIPPRSVPGSSASQAERNVSRRWNNVRRELLRSKKRPGKGALKRMPDTLPVPKDVEGKMAGRPAGGLGIYKEEPVRKGKTDSERMRRWRRNKQIRKWRTWEAGDQKGPEPVVPPSGAEILKAEAAKRKAARARQAPPGAKADPYDMARYKVQLGQWKEEKKEDRRRKSEARKKADKLAMVMLKRKFKAEKLPDDLKTAGITLAQIINLTSTMHGMKPVINPKERAMRMVVLKHEKVRWGTIKGPALEVLRSSDLVKKLMAGTDYAQAISDLGLLVGPVVKNIYGGHASDADRASLAGAVPHPSNSKVQMAKGWVKFMGMIKDRLKANRDALMEDHPHRVKYDEYLKEYTEVINRFASWY